MREIAEMREREKLLAHERSNASIKAEILTIIKRAEAEAEIAPQVLMGCLPT